jgi:hypothetical protein
MKKILASSALTLSVFFLVASAPAKAQEFFFPNAYSQPVEMVDGINVGTNVDGADIFAPKTVAVAQNCHAGAACEQRQAAHN